MLKNIKNKIYGGLVLILILSSCSSPIVPETKPEPKPEEPKPPVITKVSIDGIDSWLANAIGNKIAAKIDYNNDYFKREFKIDLDVKDSSASNTDNFLYLNYNTSQPITGNSEVVARIVSRSTSSAVGLMMREDFDQTSKYAYLTVQNNKLVYKIRRQTEVFTSASSISIANNSAIWLKLKRVNNNFSAFYSEDGVAWTQVANSETINMSSKINLGIALSSKTKNRSSTVIDSIAIHSKYYYLSPTGNDASSGSAEAPWRSFDYAIPRLKAGDVLVLQDGIYKASNSGVLEISEYSKARNGTESAPITVRAEHERKALISGEGKNYPVYIYKRSNWIIEGIAARNSDRSGSRSHRGHVIFVHGDKNNFDASSHILLKRVLAYWPNRYGNNHGILVDYSQDIAIEEAEIYSFHRHGIDAYGSNRVVIRRVYINSNNQNDRSGASRRSNGQSLLKNGGDEAVALYGSSNSIVENSIAENRQTGFVVNGGIWPSNSTTNNRFVAKNNLFAGNINYNGVIGAGVNSREYYNHLFQTTGNRFENLLIINPESGEYDSGRALNMFSVPELELSNITVYTNYDGYPSAAKIKGFLARERSDIKCEELSVNSGKCGFSLRNSLIWAEGKQNSHSQAFSLGSKPSKNIVEYNNIYGFADIGAEDSIADTNGEFRNNTQQAPSGFKKYNSGLRRFLVWIPDNSNMKNRAKDGADMGANIRKRYNNGILTDEDLWKDAEFPCGAEISNSLISSLDIYPMGKCTTIAERLRVTGP